MEKPLEQMYIITAPCWKCRKTLNVAVVKSDIKKSNDFRGPELFSEIEKKIAKNHDVIIKEHYSQTRQETYCANTCPNCDTFIGKHYLFTDYFVSAICGDYEYKVIDII